MTNDRPKLNKPNPRPQPIETIQPIQPQPQQASGGNRQPASKLIKKKSSSENKPKHVDIKGQIPSPWLKEEPSIANAQDTFVGFPEYLRWMREADRHHKESTKVQILHLAAEKATSYKNRLKELTDRTKLLAGESNTFQAKSSWRSRVGGHRGPESILLPAFDALGIPYLPSSTLRGVARNQGIRELMAEKEMDYEKAVKEIAPYFGSIDTNKPEDRSGKVIFFDAYPHSSALLAVDMANNIWKWQDDRPIYAPNPNPFLSLKESTFTIGIKKTSRCDDQTFDRVKKWLISGLQSGIGSQINSGYGEMTVAGENKSKLEILRVEFTLEGQLIHGQQKFTQWEWKDKRQEYQMRGQPVAEVRPIAFKSMLRYWFRAFALGVLAVDRVQTLEGKIFGAITPTQQQGLLQFNIADRDDGNSQAAGKNDDVREQSGTLIISYSTAKQPQFLDDLIKNLTWMMFRLGGIGQGARRPCYYRGDREYAKPPFYRGSTLVPFGDDFWKLPAEIVDFQKRFQERLSGFYTALAEISGEKIDRNKLNQVGTVSLDTWQQAIDLNCKIIVCSGAEDYGKPFALACLHSPELKLNGNYDPNLCGTATKDRVEPSPVWIRALDNYQVVTVFGANVDPRQKFLQQLRQDSQNYQQIFPFL